MTRILSLDTTSKNVSLALAEDQQVILEHNFKSRQELSSNLVPLIETILTHAGWKIEDIDLFGICVGPGLFTGIRIGLSTLKGLVFANPTPMVPVTSLEALAYKQRGYNQFQEVVPLIDAKREEVYIAGFDNSNSDLQQTLAPKILHIDQLPGAVKDIPHPFFTGSGVDAHRELLAERFGVEALIPRSPYLAGEISALAYGEFIKGRALMDPQKILPLYIRQPDAQQNYEKAVQNASHRKSPA